MKEPKQLAINMIAQAVALAINFGINFFLTPFIIEHIGREANGFVALGNNFINYASLITVALNSMAGRFITISIHRDDYKSANQYYSSVIIANVLITAVLSIPSVWIVWNIGSIVSVPADIYGDVQILWFFLFLNFLVGIITSALGVLLFAANRIDLQARHNMGAYFIKGGVLFLAFAVFRPKVWYIGFTSVICTVYLALANQHDARKLYPQIRLRREDFRLQKVKELVSSGIWNTVSRVGSIALTELDLLLSDLFISAEAMGTLSIAKTVPTYVTTFVSSIINAFLPRLVIDYAAESKSDLIRSVKSCTRVLIFLQSLIYGLLFSFTDVFFLLWLPEGTPDIQYIYLLSMITISSCFVSSVSYIMSNIFTVTNHICIPSFVTIGTGIMSFIVTWGLLKTTDLGLIAIAGVSVVLVVIRNIVILLPYGAKCIDSPWYTFFPDLFLNITVVFSSIAVGFIAKKLLLHSDTWLNFLFAAACAAFVMAVVNFQLVLKKEERTFLLGQLQGILLKFKRR